jgi:hypothetical protein
MKVFFTLAICFLMLFCTHLAIAKDKGSPHADANQCTLKNKVFCKEWQDNDGFKTTILGNKLLSSDNVPVEDCIIDKKYPYTILKCTYFNSAINRSQTDYELYYMSQRTEKENARVRGFENIFNVTAQSLRELFLLPEWDKDKDGRPIPTRAGGYLYRETQK